MSTRCALLLLLLTGSPFLAGSPCPAATANLDTSTPPGQDVPPIPTPTFDDAELQTTFEDGLKLLDTASWVAARTLFRKIRLSAPGGEQRDAIQRGLMEAEGQIKAGDLAEQIGRGRHRKAYKELLKIRSKATYDQTFAGRALRELLEKCEKEIFFDIDDFEEKKSTDSSEAGADEEEDESPKKSKGKKSGYGPNSSVIQGTVEKGEVRAGERALNWRTGTGLSFVSFDNLPERLSEFRYLRLSIRSEEKDPPLLRVLFDCDELKPGKGAGGARGRGRRAAAALERDGFHQPISVSLKWKDLRLDLRKFAKRGKVRWSDAVSLRILHVSGGEGRILIDQIRLERE